MRLSGMQNTTALSPMRLNQQVRFGVTATEIADGVATVPQSVPKTKAKAAAERKLGGRVEELTDGAGNSTGTEVYTFALVG